jgi:hypothetical protein
MIAPFFMRMQLTGDNAISVVVMFSLWRQNRTRGTELAFWLADFILFFLALLMFLLRGILPDAISIMLGYPLTLAGALLLYIGLERYTGKRTSQRHNLPRGRHGMDSLYLGQFGETGDSPAHSIVGVSLSWR